MQSFQLSARARRLKSLTITAGFYIGNKELIHITLPCPTAFTLNPHPPPYDELLPTQTLLRATAALPKLGTMGFVLFHRLTSLSPARPASAHSLPFSLYFFFSVHTVPASAPPAQTNTAQTDVNSHSNSGAAGAPHRWMKDIYHMACVCMCVRVRVRDESVSYSAFTFSTSSPRTIGLCSEWLYRLYATWWLLISLLLPRRLLLEKDHSSRNENIQTLIFRCFAVSVNVGCVVGVPRNLVSHNRWCQHWLRKIIP